MLVRILSLLALLIAAPFAPAFAQELPVKIQKGDHVVLVGNTLAERMQYFGHWETLLHSRFPKEELVVRNLGWSADEIGLRPRSKDFKDHKHTLADHKPNVLLAFFGFNESFAGPAGVAKFEQDLEGFLKAPQNIDNYSTARSNWDKTADKTADLAPLPMLRQIVLVSPVAHENLKRHGLPDGKKNNANLKLYAEAMARVAAKHKVAFVDIFTPTLKAMADAKQPLTINGVHLNEHGDQVVGEILDRALFGLPTKAQNEQKTDFARLKAEVNEKNGQFFHDHRSVNGFYIYGGRKEPFGVVNFPAEFAKLRKMTANRDQRIWEVAQGKQIPSVIDDSNTGEFTKIETNFKTPVLLTTPEESRKKMKLAEGYEVNLFASEEEFPDLQNPVQFAFDAKGRLWVTTMPSYPQYLPGTPVNDKILILEDTNGDGKADKQTVFADKLHVPTGIELGDGGCYVAQQPNLLFLKDTNGDDVADERTIVLHGFDSADSHHSISAFTWDQGGALYFEEGTFHHSQVETPYGPTRCVNAGVFRFEPKTFRFSTFVSYNFANPWGHIVDGWGQNFIADASGGDNYYGTAFSGDLDYPDKHGGMKKFLVKQWRPTAGCELVSSRNFPAEAQGNFLLNNCIGFQGVLQYKMKDEGSGFAADPVEPLLSSTDPNFRPVDIEFAPDGTLFLCDWFNPLVGHMQHNLRDPNRDHIHGRIWRVRYAKQPLVTPSKIAGESIVSLLDTLKSAPEERTRYRIRTELRSRPTEEVLAEVKKWTSSLDPKKVEDQHQFLEALWIHQQHDVVNEPFLKQMLKSPEPKTRAAATRVLCYWRDRVSKPLELLKAQVNDENPRVRLEAVRALSFFDNQEAIDIATESLIYDQDDYLKYTLQETMSTLEKRVKKK
ncbi:MAG: PVC-type heme-binding CxxCH protein [Pirellulaceae bacterium]